MSKTASNSTSHSGPKSPPRIENLRVQNYRALRDVEFKNITPLMTLLGPNGSGKSTVFDVFNFLSECLQYGLRHAWDRRGRARELKTRGQDGPVMARYVSDGTLKMLSYLVVLMDPEPPQFIGIEEPENFLHPRLLPELAEECRAASERSQLLVTTHSPFFLNGMRPEEVRVIYRDEEGYSQVQQASEVQGIREFVAAGASMGQLWMEGRLGMGDPLVNAGVPIKRGKK